MKSGKYCILCMLAIALLLSACDLTRGDSFDHSLDSIATDDLAESMPDLAEKQEITTEALQPYEPQLVGVTQHMIAALMDYFSMLNKEGALPEYSFEILMDKSKNSGVQPLHVKFDAENFYYVCAYYNPTHEHPEYEKYNYCCVGEYTWVKFDSPDQILDHYNDLGFVCAFQFNRTQFCKSLGSQGGIFKDMEHYQLYKPDFIQGLNVLGEIAFDQSFIYFSETQFETEYYTVAHPDHFWNTLHCVELDGQYYVPHYLYTVNAEGLAGELDTEDLKVNFGKYYDHVMSVMITDLYTLQDQSGNTNYYGLISVDEIENIIQQ